MERRPPRTRRHGAPTSLIPSATADRTPTSEPQANATYPSSAAQTPSQLAGSSRMRQRRPNPTSSSAPRRTLRPHHTTPVGDTREKARGRSPPPTQRLTSIAGRATSCVYSFPQKKNTCPSRESKQPPRCSQAQARQSSSSRRSSPQTHPSLVRQGGSRAPVPDSPWWQARRGPVVQRTRAKARERGGGPRRPPASFVARASPRRRVARSRGHRAWHSELQTARSVGSAGDYLDRIWAVARLTQSRPSQGLNYQMKNTLLKNSQCASLHIAAVFPI